MRHSRTQSQHRDLASRISSPPLPKGKIINTMVKVEEEDDVTEEVEVQDNSRVLQSEAVDELAMLDGTEPVEDEESQEGVEDFPEPGEGDDAADDDQEQAEGQEGTKEDDFALPSGGLLHLKIGSNSSIGLHNSGNYDTIRPMVEISIERDIEAGPLTEDDIESTKELFKQVQDLHLKMTEYITITQLHNALDLLDNRDPETGRIRPPRKKLSANQ